MSKPEQRLAAGLEAIGTRLSNGRYSKALNAMMTLAFYRLALLRSLVIGTLILLCPALLDAAVRRTVRTHQFQRHCPERCTFGLAGGLIACAALVAYTVAPLHLHPAFAWSAIATIIYFLCVVLANYHHSAG
ncbi:DUF4400 domain-containing protein [Massilia sp. YMA4]|uniref:DUF4400 domain-containing protein n=1 Tax=Massilia sp. YMA4 TaxID=1593482 RepID=UPI0035A388F0